MSFRGPDTAADADTDRDLIFQTSVDRTLTADGMFQTLAGDFGSATPGSGTTFAGFQSFLADGGTIEQVQVNFNLPGGNDFGRDADNVFRADNLMFNQVPEPGSLGLLGAGALLALRRRRRVR